MTVSQEEFQTMVEDMTTDLIRLTMEREGLTMAQAFAKVYNSAVYTLLHNPDTQLYYQSPGYVYSCMQEAETPHR